MTGMGHLSTALLLKAKAPRAPLVLLFIVAEAPDLLWAILNFAIDRLTHTSRSPGWNTLFEGWLMPTSQCSRSLIRFSPRCL
jgi:hypothetical protein